MPDPTPHPAAAAPEPPKAPQAGEPPKTHHSQLQPRDDAKRFAGPPAQPPPGQPAAPQGPPVHRVKYRENGKEIEEDLTLEELIEDRRRLRALRFKETEAVEREKRAAQLAQQAEEARVVAAALENDDLGPLKAYYAKRGKEPVDGLATLLQRALDERDMDPNLRALAEERAEKERLKSELERRETEEADREFYGKVDRIREQLQAKWTELLKAAELPATEEMLETAASFIVPALELGHTLPHEQVIALTRERMLDMTAKPLVNAMGPEQFLKHFSGEGSIVSKMDAELSPEAFIRAMPEFAKRFHRYLYEQARAKALPRGQNQAQTQAPATPAPKNGSTPKVYDPFTGSGFGA